MSAADAVGVVLTDVVMRRGKRSRSGCPMGLTDDAVLKRAVAEDEHVSFRRRRGPRGSPGYTPPARASESLRVGGTGAWYYNAGCRHFV